MTANLEAITPGRRRVRKRDTYAGFPGCRRKRQPSCAAQDSAFFAFGSFRYTCSLALFSGRSLAYHTFLTLSKDSSVSIESGTVQRNH